MVEPRLNLSVTNGTVDLVTSKLPALQAYQLSLKAPAPPAGSFDSAAAERGKLVFEGAGQMCHLPQRRQFHRRQLDVASAWRLDGRTGDAQLCIASATKQYRTSPLRGRVAACAVFPRRLGGNAGRSGTNVQHQEVARFEPQEVSDLAQYLKSL